MSNTNARSAFGSVFKFSSVASTGTFATVAGVTKITPFKHSRGTLDVTDMYSTDYYEDTISAGPIRTGTMGVTCNYLSTDTYHTGIIQDCLEAGNRIGWLFTVAGTSSMATWYGDGVITAFSMGDLTIDGKVEFNLELKTKGAPVGPASSTT